MKEKQVNNKAKNKNWNSEIDNELAKTYQLLMKKDVFTIEYLLLEIISEKNKWTAATFEKLYTSLEYYKTHLNNMVQLLSAKNKAEIFKETGFNSISFLDKVIFVKEIEKNSVFQKFMLSDKKTDESIGIFDVDFNANPMIKEFIEKLKEIILSKIEQGAHINFDNNFIVGKSENGNFEIFNTIKSLERITDNSLKTIKISEISEFYIMYKKLVSK